MNTPYDRIDDTLITEAEFILDHIGLDVPMAINIMLKRIIKEKNISFLLNQSFDEKTEESSSSDDSTFKMTKTRAIALFRSKNCPIVGYTTFASKNQISYTYWANPNFDVLNKQWNLILNDWINHEVHLFSIPANSIKADSLVCRADKKHQIDLQIMYNDLSFTDTRSKISFSPYLIMSQKY